jgi:hypothetical protein
MLTIFTIPKDFQDHIEVIQRNAIQSWLHLHPPCEVILCGDALGTAEVSAEFGISHIQDINCNEYNTPLLSSAFEHIQRISKNRLVCYVNADIMLLSDLMDAVKKVPFQEFLLIGQRWDLDLVDPLDFTLPDWSQKLITNVRESGKLHPPSGSDYFIFPKGTIGKIPDFAVGRPGWDNWFIYRARELKRPVIDATRVVTAIHQNHGYQHVPNGQNNSYRGPEADHNLGLVGGSAYLFILNDATHKLTSDGLEYALDDIYILQRLKRQRILDSRPGIFPRLKGKLFMGFYKNFNYLPKVLLRWLARNYLK